MNHESFSVSPNHLTAEQAVDKLDSETERVVALRSAIAATAIHNAQEHASLRAAMVRLTVATFELTDDINDMPISEKFGDEESYWTVFRMFTIENYRGYVWSLDDIVAHLRKNYDLVDETLKSIEATLEEWGADIEADASSRGIPGRFTQLANGFVFAELSPPKPSVVETRAPITTVTPEKKPTPPQDTLAVRISDILENAPERTLKQAALKKAVLNESAASSLGQLQLDVDRIVGSGAIYKFYRDKVAYLSLDPQDDKSSTERYENSEREEDLDVTGDVILSIDILEALTTPGTHFNQKFTLSELWRLIHGHDTKSQSIPQDELDQLKMACRRLQGIHLVTAGGVKMGTGGIRTNTASSKKRKRSASRQVFKVGLETQANKVAAQNLLKNPDAIDYLTEKFTAGLNELSNT